MKREQSSSSIPAIKLVIAASPSVDILAYLQGLAAFFPNSQLRDYAIGALDALHWEAQISLSSPAPQTVPISMRGLLGHVHFHSIQEVLLGHADGIVVLLDMQPSQRNAKMQTILQTVQGLRRQGLDIRLVPLVLQYCNADHASEAMIAEWDELLDWERNEIPRFLSAAHQHEHSVPAIEALVQRVLALPRLTVL